MDTDNQLLAHYAQQLEADRSEHEVKLTRNHGVLDQKPLLPLGFVRCE